ncbi:MAG: 30S ribosomal protein S12 methylthiotransferase RimO [Prevotella sp.]|nr:30S ribosomal protein S12 methylthiotransferase RimO [Prevotella sp.]
MIHNRIDIVTLGCYKNLVDSECLQKMFCKKGYECYVDAPEVKGKTVVINTCGFIGDAKEESVNTILQFVEAKKHGEIDTLYVMGCLSERYLADLQQEIPEVDKYYGKFDWSRMVDEMPESEGTKQNHTEITPKRNINHYRYIKISEGCDRHCAYCAIPAMTGKHKSRRIEDIISEVKELVSEGVREFQIIAQELTYYGVDIYGKRSIAELISQMADIKGVEWIRLHYAYPNLFPMELLDVMREKDNVCKYLDIALQHISTSVLKRMKRDTTKEETMQLVSDLRKRVPGIVLRTTLMVGFPGETDKDFDELVEFVKWARFERMGAFAYSEEDGTYSADHYEDDVPEEIKQQRLDKLMRVQQRISAEIMEENIGKTMKVIIDRKEGEWYVGRNEYSSPEVDPEVLLHADNELKTGEFYNVKITAAEEFDLYGELVK